MQKRLTLLIPSLMFLTHCGNVVTNSITTPSCQTNTVLILVGDNFLNPLCGCQEIAGQSTPPSSPTLTCTFTSGSTVIFDFTGTKQKHQIRFSAGSTHPDTPSYNLAVNKYPSTFGFQVPTAGSYSFYDAINPTITGTLVAQ